MARKIKVAGYRDPWTGGAKAYPEADSLTALWEGVRRKRKSLTVHVSHDALRGVPCAGCGLDVTGPYAVNPGEPATHEDRSGYAYVDVSPSRGEAVPRHYYCAWGHTMSEVIKLRELTR